MEFIWIKFLKDWKEYEPGDVATVGYSSPQVQRLIDQGIAERYIQKKKAEIENGNND